jgi:hypothetical protein
VDGCDFDTVTDDTLLDWKQLAVDQNTAIWFAAIQHRENLQMDDRGIPAPVNRFTDSFSVIIMLEPEQDFINFKLLKDRDSTNLEELCLKLDPKTLLISIK